MIVVQSIIMSFEFKIMFDTKLKEPVVNDFTINKNLNSFRILECLFMYIYITN